MNELREAAISYTLRGWSVFPLKPRSKKPNHQLVPEGYLQASDWAPDCLYWWEREPDGNIGIACRPSGLVVIDVDERAGGHDTMYDWVQSHGEAVAPIQLTPSGGVHYIFKHPGMDLKGHLGPGVDIKDHGYILAEPSVHPNGGIYRWETELEPGEMPLTWVADLRVMRTKRPQNFSLSPSQEPLLQISAEDYAQALTGRTVDHGGWMTCPFHRDGMERTPSFKVSGTMWACFACEPMLGKQVMGGNLLDLAGMLKGYAMPLRGTDLQIVKAEMERFFLEPSDAHEC